VTKVSPQHPRPWTLDEVLALPEDNGQRIELIDGMLVVSPAPTPTHQRFLQWLQLALDAAVPAGMELLPGVNVVLNGRRRLLIPDLVVTNVPGHTSVYFTGDQIVLAAEILSPSSRSYDRLLKRQLYAEAGVPYYLVVDPAGVVPSAVVMRLTGAGYCEQESSSDGLLSMRQPFPAVVRLGGAALAGGRTH
jgi:Uma2 family endonuclease